MCDGLTTTYLALATIMWGFGAIGACTMFFDVKLKRTTRTFALMVVIMFAATVFLALRCAAS